jgi:hypothetical protein
VSSFATGFPSLSKRPRLNPRRRVLLDCINEGAVEGRVQDGGASSQRYSPDQPALSHFARRLNYILIYIRSVPRECGTHGKCMRERLQPLCFIIPPEFCTTTFSHCQLFHLRSNLKRTRQNDRRLLRLSCS